MMLNTLTGLNAYELPIVQCTKSCRRAFRVDRSQDRRDEQRQGKIARKSGAIFATMAPVKGFRRSPPSKRDQGEVMPGRRKTDFSWQEIAKVLRITRSENRAGFWHEIERSPFKSLATRKSPARFGPSEKDADTLRLRRSRVDR